MLNPTLPPKFVQPSMKSQESGSTGFAHVPPGQSASVVQPLPFRVPFKHVLSPKFRIEFTTIVCTYVDG